MTVREVDNLIVGAGLVGGVTARVLAEHGEGGVLVERNPEPGGVNGSFSDAFGNRFDHGRHIIDADRSAFTTRFVESVLPGELRRFELTRGLVVRGHVVPYAAGVEHWPEALRDRIDIDPDAAIRLGAPREAFARTYGRWLADLAFDEMMRAYPPLVWQRERGIPEERLMRWIFPWFFPRSAAEAPPDETEAGVYSAEARDYHYRRRHAEPPTEDVLYPASGGFARLVEALIDGARGRFDILLGADDVAIDIDPASLNVDSVTTGGVTYRPRRVFWCAPLPVLCKHVGWQLPGGEPQWELLGSFTFRRPVELGYHELLFADPEHRIRRVYSPDRIAGREPAHTLQVEYTTVGPEADEPGGTWRERWLASLAELGLVDGGNEVADFDYRRLSRGVVSTEDLGGFLEACESRIAGAEGNLVAPHLAVASDNNCRLIPKVYRRLAAAVGAAAPDAGQEG